MIIFYRVFGEIYIRAFSIPINCKESIIEMYNVQCTSHRYFYVENGLIAMTTMAL